MRYVPVKAILVNATLAGVLVIAAASTAGAAPARKSTASARPAPIAVPLDPAGTYSAYPEWARRALAPKAGGGGR